MSATNQGQNSADMDATALRIRVAELLGTADRFVLVKRGFYWRPNGHGYTSNPNEAWILSESEADKYVYPHDEPVTKEHAPLPDYPNDLNACHEFEQALTSEQATDYGWELDRLTKAGCGTAGGPSGFDLTRLATATAEQRCRAFVATMEANSVGHGTEKSLAAPGSQKPLEEH